MKMLTACSLLEAYLVEVRIIRSMQREGDNKPNSLVVIKNLSQA